LRKNKIDNFFSHLKLKLKLKIDGGGGGWTRVINKMSKNEKFPGGLKILKKCPSKLKPIFKSLPSSCFPAIHSHDTQTLEHVPSIYLKITSLSLLLLVLTSDDCSSAVAAAILILFTSIDSHKAAHK
jgi:hypothetical protein